MDVGERGRNKVAQLKNILDVKAQQNRPAPVTCLNPPKVNKYLSKDYLAYKVGTHNNNLNYHCFLFLESREIRRLQKVHLLEDQTWSSFANYR